MQDKRFLIIGNDKKMNICKNKLITMGYDCVCADGETAINMLNAYTYVILPLPTISNGCVAGTGITLDELDNKLNSRQILLYGNISKYDFHCKSFSYYYNEEFLIKNSRLTAQGVLRTILQNTDEDLYNLNAAVIGYGKCGKAICKSLKSNGINITSFSRRRETIALAENEGIAAKLCKDIEGSLYEYDIIVNTVPSNIISLKSVEKLTSKNMYIEVASKPYGFDISKSDKYSFRYILAESLPGRFYPTSAGENIAETVLNILKEGEYE